jgi:predicted nucleic acid-binding protein
MIVYCDTSALIKLYVEEAHSSAVAKAIADVDAIATSLLAYPETRASLARAQRDRRLRPSDFRQALAQFQQDWSSYVVLDTHHSLMLHAGELAEHHALRGADAIHLASAIQLAHDVKSSPKPMAFLAFDVPLARAAAREHLLLHALSPKA